MHHYAKNNACYNAFEKTDKLCNKPQLSKMHKTLFFYC